MLAHLSASININMLKKIPSNADINVGNFDDDIINFNIGNLTYNVG